MRPNSGRIEPGRDVEVQVLLQAMKEDPPPDARCRDKFLVQSVAITADKDVSNVTQIWQNVEQTAKSSIQERKIRVTFLPADGSAVSPVASATNGVSHHDEEPPAYSSPSPVAVTPARSVVPDSKSPPQEMHSSADLGQSQSSLGGAIPAFASATGISEADLRRQLEEAKNTISRLQQQAAEQTGLRQRKTGADTASGSKTTTASLQSNPPAGGVSVQITALLCLLSFLIAYLFF